MRISGWGQNRIRWHCETSPCSLRLRARLNNDYDYEHEYEHRSFHSLSTIPATAHLDIGHPLLDIPELSYAAVAAKLIQGSHGFGYSVFE